MVGYIGKSPTVGNFAKLDSITTSATATFNLLNGGVAYYPESARHCLVSLNGVIQNPETSFNIVNNTIVFSTSLTSDDVIDYILVLGDVMSVGTPSDGTISTAKIVDDAVTTAKINNDAVTEAKLNLISTSSVPSLEAKGDGGSQDGYIQLNCSQNSHGIKLKSPAHSSAQSYTLTFPATAPATDKFLKTNSSGVLSFADAGGGAWEKLLTTTADNSATSVAFSSTYITSTYREYKIIMSDIDLATAGQHFYIYLSTDNGSSYLGSSQYDFTIGTGYVSTGSGVVGNGNPSSSIRISGHTFGNDDARNMNGYAILCNPSSTSSKCMVYGNINYWDNSTNLVTHNFAGGLDASDSAVNNIKFETQSGNITSGTFTIYGRKN